MIKLSHLPKKFSLQIHIVTLFTILIIISGATLGWFSYSQLSQNMLSSGKDLLNSSSEKVVNKISRESEHIRTMLKILCASHLVEIKSKEEKIKSLPVLSEMLKATPSLSALFIAYANDDFFLYKKVTSQSILSRYNASKDSYFMMTLRQSGKTIHHFYNIKGELLNQIEDPSYDLIIEERPWYKLAKANNTFVTTDAYIFHASQELGVTIAVDDRKNNVIIAADHTLGTLSKTLREFKAYPSSQRIIVNQHGQVVAYQDAEKLLSDDGRFDKFKHIDSIQLPVLAHVFNLYRHEKDSFLFSFNGEDWLGKVSTPSSKSHLQLLQIVKTKELLAEAYMLRDQSVFITLFIILSTLPIAWYFARLLTAPISGLTKDLEKIKNFDFNQKILSKTPIKEISDLISVTNNMKETISHFLDLSASLISKQSSQQLLTKITQECNNIPNCLGTIIIIKKAQQYQIKHCELVNFESSQNEEICHALSELNLPETQLINAEDKHKIPDNIYQIINSISNEAQYLCWRLVPMKNRMGENLGLIAILESEYSPLHDGKLQYAQAIASFSALSIQSQQLLAEQKQLLESFILLIAGAIDSQSPYTGGHCARVPELTKMLTKAACEQQNGAFKRFDLNEDQWEELHIAAWLHDCGKIVTPEYVVDKATKLETVYDRLNEIRMRFELLKVEAEKNYWKGVAQNGDPNTLTKQRDLLLKQLDDEFEFVAECNIGGEFMSDEKVNKLNDIANRTWIRTLNNKIGLAPHQACKIKDAKLPISESLLADKPEHLIEREHAELTEKGNEWGFDMETPTHRFNRGELYNLSIKRGTLTDEDRFVINGHMVHTIAMLSKLPFPEHLKDIPIIAGGHHEKMDGTGYPRKVKAAELPATARIMVIADIFEALTASDRPYKERKTLSQSIKIMSFMVKDNHIDPELFNLFLSSGVYMDYAKQYLQDDQIDNVDIQQYL